MQHLEHSKADTSKPFFEYLLRLGDDRLILGHRMSEWCGYGPQLEEDLAMANIALDLIGQAKALLEYAGEVEGEGRSEDDLAYFRDDIDFRNLQLAEQPNGDFGFTIARQFLFSTFNELLLERLQDHPDRQLAGIASKSLKETRYHVRHSRDWVLRLGDGTDESNQRIQQAFDDLWMYTAELFYMDEVDEILIKDGKVPDLKELQPEWNERVNQTLKEATLQRPDDDQYMATGGRVGFHQEELGYLLMEMQFLRRSHPEAEW